VFAELTKNKIHVFQRKLQAPQAPRKPVTAAFPLSGYEMAELAADVYSLESLVATYRSIEADRNATVTQEVTAPVPADVVITTVAPVVVAAATATALTDADMELLERAVHESAHAVAAVIFGGRIDRGYVLPAGHDRDGITGEVLVASMPVGNAAPQIAYAGPWAQAKFRAGGGWPMPDQLHAVMSTSGRLDRKQHLCASGSGDGSDVVGLIDRCWPAVIAVAKKLVRDGEIRHEHVVAALGLSDDVSRHPFELASIRSGMRRVV
jgi:hypothetical protein